VCQLDAAVYTSPVAHVNPFLNNQRTSFKRRIMSKKSNESRKEQDIRIALPERHWVVLLGILETFISGSVKPELDRLKKKGVKLKDIDDTQAVTLAGPLMIRGVIVKELVARGVMRPEADDRIGIDKLLEAAEDFKNRLAAGEFDGDDITGAV
jgi:hypothetical protein